LKRSNGKKTYGSETSDLVADTLGGKVSNLLSDTLVRVEVKGELGVVLLDQLTGSTLDDLVTNTALYKKKETRVKSQNDEIQSIWNFSDRYIK